MERLQNIAISVFKTALNHVFINRGFVGVGHGGDIVGAFRAAFDFEAGGTGVNQIIQVPQHIHVLRIEQIGAVLGLLDREVLAGALLFHDRILPAAWLGAFAVIAIAAGQIVGEQAAAGEGHAHSTVDEAFDVEVIRNVGANITHGLQVHLAGQHHTASTKLVEGVRSLIISHAGIITPISETISASTPVSLSCPTYSRMASISLLRGSTLQVTYTRAPRSWA